MSKRVTLDRRAATRATTRSRRERRLTSIPVDPPLRLRLTAWLYASGATLGAVGLLLTPSARVDVQGDVVAIALAYAIAGILYLGRSRLPAWAFHLSLVGGAGLITWAIVLNSETPSSYVMFYVWVALAASYFLPGLQAAAHAVVVALVYGLALLQNPPPDPFLRWITAVGTVVVVSAMTLALKRRIAGEAFFDSLTGLPNRALFTNRLEQTLAAREPREESVALLFLDLDRLKLVNDSFGHAAGDKLLVEAAQRMRSAVRPEDFVARLGGDEFTVLLPDIGGESEAVQIAERISSLLAKPFFFRGRQISSGARVGIALGRPGEDDPASLLQEADAALHRAKDSGETRLRIYEQRLADEAADQIALEEDLRQALRRGEFRLHYQPKVSLGEMRPSAFEALLRWNHPRRGLLMPASFLDRAEEGGLMVPIGRWVLGEACRQASQWFSERPDLNHPIVCVNLSDRQLRDPTIVEDAMWAVEAAGIEPRAVCLEVNENAAMAETSPAPTVLARLKACGVSLAIDDFGVGSSSLARLRTMPLDVLKIDRCFIDDLTVAPEAADITKAVISLGQTLGMRVIAEGVETEAQLRCLRELGCEAAQGNYFAPPLPPEEAFQSLFEEAIQ